MNWPLTLRFAHTADKGFHECQMGWLKNGFVRLSLPTVVFGPCPG
jgi:hypothetical protein